MGVVLKVATKIMFVTVAEVLYADAANVFIFGGASNVNLASVDEFLKVVFVGLGPGFHWGGLIVHGPLADFIILLVEEEWCGWCCWLLLARKEWAPAGICASRPAQCVLS